MGCCLDCLSPQPEVENPDPSEARGVRDPERLKRDQKRKENREKEALKQGPSDGGLKVTEKVPFRIKELSGLK
ncbi:hypothetical protein P5673_012958, partial [Acropora cervicornis]